MRSRIPLPAAVAALAIAAFLVHLLVPLGQFTVTTESGIQEAYLYPGDLHHIGDDRVVATGQGTMLTGLVLLVIGSIAMLAACLIASGSRRTVSILGGLVAAAGAGLSLVSQGLWAGRLVTATIHQVLGSDGPPSTFDAEGWAGPDVGVTAWTISAPIVLAIVVAILGLLGRIWSADVADTRNLPEAARSQQRILFTATIAFAIALLVPWSAVQLTDAGGEDTDMFFWSAYDVLAIHDASQTRALEVSEFGIMQYRGLSALLGMVIVAGLVVIMASAVALVGIRLDGDGDGVLGRLLENATFLGGLATVFLALATFLGAFWMHVPNDFHDATITALPLLILVPLGWTVQATWTSVRRLMAEDQDLLADDFPEPIIYD